MPKLAVGDKMPNFTFNTAYHSGLTIAEILPKQQRTVFWVLRYIGCTTCRYDLHQLAGNYQKFLDLDSQIYVVMQSEPANVREYLAEHALPFEIICDSKQEIYQTLMIPATATREERQPTEAADLAKLADKMAKLKAGGFVHGKYEGNEQQLPALFVVEQNGTVSYAHYAKNSIDMPEVEAILELLRSMK
ncbi:MAG: redoxin domain-containing protein [Negativicutes bacterium]|nr:redoxin domain-containing protein [Negativicutes bacterium]